METALRKKTGADEAFDALAAERESLLQPLVFVEPPAFSTYVGMRSLVIFGASGAGKTALRMALTRAVNPDQAPPTHLVARWQPELIEGEYGSPAVRRFARQALADCAVILLQTLARHPQLYSEAPPTVKDALHWFAQANLASAPDRDRLLAALSEEGGSEAGIALCRHLLNDPAPPVLRSDVAEQRIITLLAQSIQRMGLRGAWVVMDGFEPWLRSAQSELSALLNAILSTLELFELHGFALKIIAPLELATDITRSWGARKGRIDIYTLEWSAAQLLQIVERHIAAKIERKAARLNDICAAQRDIQAWLERYGGATPRGWLRLVSPLVNAFITTSAARPLTPDEWRTLQRAHPPPLRIDLDTDRVFIGEAEIRSLQPASYRLLRYLYEHRDRRVSRSELYYRVYRGLNAEPNSPDDPSWEDTKTWGNVLDNALLRLRRQLEPDPRDPIYIVTDRGWGIRLKHTF